MLVLLGCNHRSAPLELRERLAFAESDLQAALSGLLGRDAIEEALILSTCNRVELLVRATEAAAGIQSLKEFLCERGGLSPQEIDDACYVYLAREAVEHLFQVAAGLDSMVLGEPQIQRQVKQAYLAARDAGATGSVLERLLQQCLASARRVRRETGISRHAVSVGFAAVELARRIFGRLEGRSALLLGAGKMSDLVARQLVAGGLSDLTVASRTYPNAAATAARFQGRAIRWHEAAVELERVDVVLSCTGAHRPLLDKTQVARAARARRGRPLFLIDIAVPRDVDPHVNELDNVYLFDIDALQGVADANLEERRQEAARAALLIVTDVEAFDRWQQVQEVAPLITSLRERVLEVGLQELARYRRRLGPLSPEQESSLRSLVRTLTQKILHRPTVHLRRSIERGELEACASLYREIFGVDVSAPRTSRKAEPFAVARRMRGGRADG
jgi:glutamyl-tRNA reductase